MFFPLQTMYMARPLTTGVPSGESQNRWKNTWVQAQPMLHVATKYGKMFLGFYRPLAITPFLVLVLLCCSCRSESR